MLGCRVERSNKRKKTVEPLGRKADGAARRQANPRRRPPSPWLAPRGGRLIKSASMFPCMKVTNILRSYVIEGAPITQERIRGPSSHGLNYVRGSTRYQKLGCSSNPEAMTGCARIAETMPDLVASSQEDWFRQGGRTMRGHVREQVSICRNVVDK